MTPPARARTMWLLLLLLGIPAPRPLHAESLELRPGFQRILEHSDVTHISVGNPEVLEARPLSRNAGVLVVGKKEGETDLVVWAEGTRTERKVTVRNRAKTLLSYDLKIIEISKGSTEQLGIRWPDSFGVRGSWSTGGAAGSTFALASDFEATLHLLLSDGRARVLANPKLVCETGESASFLAGGEIPIVIVTPETRTVEWKTYGIILKLSPTMEDDTRIGTSITAEISTVEHGGGSSDVPALLTRRVTTRFSTSPGETVMLSGLVKSEMAKDVVKLPLLGQIPVLGELFKSRKFRENRSELAIFITPAAAVGSAREVAEWRNRDREARESMRYRLLD